MSEGKWSTGKKIGIIGGGVVLLTILVLVLKSKKATAATTTLPATPPDANKYPQPPVYKPPTTTAGGNNFAPSSGSGTPTDPWSKQDILSITDARTVYQTLKDNGGIPPPIPGGIGADKNKPNMKSFTGKDFYSLNGWAN